MLQSVPITLCKAGSSVPVRDKTPKISFNLSSNLHVACSVTQSCPTLCNPMDYSPPDSSVHGTLQARILGGYRFLLLGIFQTQGSNPRLLHCRRILYHWATWEAQSSCYRPGNSIDTIKISSCFAYGFISSTSKLEVLSFPVIWNVSIRFHEIFLPWQVRFPTNWSKHPSVKRICHVSQKTGLERNC